MFPYPVENFLAQQPSTEGVQQWIEASVEPLFATIDYPNMIGALIDTRIFGHRPVIIYHADCADGLVGALMVYKFMKQHLRNEDYPEVPHASSPPRICYEPVLIAARYGDDPPQLDPLTTGLVVIVDFSYTYEQLQAMSQQADELVVIDHHYSAVSKLLAEHKKAPTLTNFHMYLATDAQNRHASGARLAADLLHARSLWSDIAVNSLVTLASDYDLWLHDGNPESDPAALNFFIKAILAQDRQAIAKLMMLDQVAGSPSIEPFLKMGQILARPVIERIKRQLEETKTHRIEFVGGAFHVPGCPMPHADASLAAYYLKNNAHFSGAQFSMTWDHKGDGRVEYSLRSVQPDFDVSEVAAHYGGGGHKKAAGFVLNHTPGSASSPLRIRASS